MTDLQDMNERINSVEQNKDIIKMYIKNKYGRHKKKGPKQAKSMYIKNKSGQKIGPK